MIYSVRNIIANLKRYIWQEVMTFGTYFSVMLLPFFEGVVGTASTTRRFNSANSLTLMARRPIPLPQNAWGLCGFPSTKHLVCQRSDLHGGHIVYRFFATLQICKPGLYSIHLVVTTKLLSPRTLLLYISKFADAPVIS